VQPTLEEYAESLRQLLPQGSIWRTELGTRLRQLLDALAGRLLAAHARAVGLLDEADPRTTTELIMDWERVAGLPGPCGELGETLQQRRAALVQALTATGGASAAYFIALAESLGYPGVTITGFDPFRAGDPVGGAVTGDAIAFVWQVNVPIEVAISSFRVGQSVAGEPLRAWGNEQLECAFEHRKPAHTQILFAYGGA
jgi:uncharacterized protein YmfQ (DUF2313 family)